MREWYGNVVKEVENGEYPQIKVFVRRNKLNMNDVNVDTVLRWMCNVKEMRKKAEKIPKNGIRRYFEI